MTLDMSSATVTMTQAQLVEYTERVVRETTRKTERKRDTMLQTLEPVYAQLKSAYVKLALDPYSGNWKSTEHERAAMARHNALTSRRPSTIAEAREQIAVARRAIRAKETSRARFERDWRRQEEKDARKLEKDTIAWNKHCDAHHRKAKKSGNCMDKDECPSMRLKLAVRRVVLDAPPLTNEQGRTLRGLLFG